MKILWLRPSKGENISVRRERIAEHLSKRGVIVDIQDSSGADSLTAIWRACTGDYDIIAGNVRMGLYIGYPLARLLGIPFLGDVSDPLSDIGYLPGPLVRLLAWYEWEVLKRADAAVFVYESSYREALSRGIDAIKLSNAVDFDLFSQPDEEVVKTAGEILEEHQVDLSKPMAIYIGVLTENYHISDIIGAARLSPDWEFVFLGEGRLEAAVTTASEALGNVHFPGAFEYRLIPGFLAHADVGFCFKDAEQPLKLKEYGAAGLPVIVQHGELERWFEEDALVFIDPSPKQIAETLERTNREEFEGIVQVDKLRAVAKAHSWRSVAESYFELFQSMVDR